MKTLFSAILMALCAFATATDYSHYYKNLPVEIEQVTPVVVPDTRVSLTEFGAKGDGQTLCSEAFQKAVKALVKQGGGHLDVPAGTWLTGPIELKSNIDLHLEEGATILMSTDKNLYVKSGSKRFLAGIRASKAENVCITGKGVIDGQGQYWRPVKRVKVTDEEWAWCLGLGGTVRNGNLWLPYNLNNGMPSIGESAEEQEAMRNHLVQITDSKNVLIEGVTLKDSPKFHLVPSRVRNLIIENVTVTCPWNAQNGDAIDPGNVQTALIVGCTISCGDDGICMKGGVGEAGVKAGPNSDFLIQDNTVYRAHGGFVIGSEFSGGMHRLIVRNCDFIGTDIGLRFKSAPGRGGTCSDIYCYNIRMKDIINEAILFQTSYADQGAVFSATAGDDRSQFFPDFCNVSISDVTVDGAKTAMLIGGMPGHPVHDITLHKVKMKNCKNGLIFKNAERITLTKTKIKAQKPNDIDAASCKQIKLK